MGVFGRIEKGIQSAVDWVFRRGGLVEIPELTQRLQKELNDKAQPLSRDRWLAPNQFTIALSKADYARLFPLSRTMTEEISADLEAYAADVDYTFPGPIQITYEERPDLPTGRFAITSRQVAEVLSPSASRPACLGELILEVNGVRHPLVPGAIVIGRSHEANITITDPGMSRAHAEISVQDAPGRRRIHIRDLDSRNGIFVNDEKTAEADLSEGDRITLGSTKLLVRAPTGR
ncbi:MAG: DUF3662 domain-containing protein [Propionibacteriaceae bacterium]|jgi:hypothetical protein|nr:DUF3662 domain-containing protein [Propionibacteriaceae bacterium]